jgi:hypothetical protein
LKPRSVPPSARPFAELNARLAKLSTKLALAIVSFYR